AGQQTGQPDKHTTQDRKTQDHEHCAQQHAPAPSVSPAMAAAPWPWPNLTHPKLAGKRKKHVLAVAHHDKAQQARGKDAARSPSFTSAYQRNKFLARAGWKNRPSMPARRASAHGAGFGPLQDLRDGR